MTLLVAASITCVAMVVYVATAARDITFGDTPEWIAVAVTLGVGHPPGYPVFTLLGHLFAQLPVGTIPFRVALVSVASSAATVGVVYLTARRLTRDHLAAAAAALLLAFNPLFWRWSLVAEVFPLGNLFAAVATYLLVLWTEAPARAWPLIAGGLVAGLAMSNQQTFVLLAPAALYVLWRQRRALLERPEMLGWAAGAVVLGLLPYGYLLWAAPREPYFNWGDIASLGDLVGHILRQGYGTGQLIAEPGLRGGHTLERLWLLVTSFTPAEGPLGLLGAYAAYRRLRWYFWFTVVGFAVSGPLFVAYSNANVSVAGIGFVLERFFLLPHVVAAPLIAFGLVWIAGRIAALAGARSPARWRAAVAGAACAAALAQVVISYPATDASDDHVARRFAEDIFATVAPRGILLVSGDPVALPLGYLQAVDGARPDVAVIFVSLLPSDAYVRHLHTLYPDLAIPFARLDGRSGTTKALLEANPGRPVSIMGDAPDASLDATYWLYRRGLVYDVRPLPPAVRLETMAKDNDALLAAYGPPPYETVRSRAWERLVLREYAQAPYLVGKQYEIGKATTDARTWYERALRLDPEYQDAVEALRALAR